MLGLWKTRYLIKIFISGLFFMCLFTNLSKHFMMTVVGAIGWQSLRHDASEVFSTGMMVDVLSHHGTLD